MRALAAIGTILVIVGIVWLGTTMIPTDAPHDFNWYGTAIVTGIGVGLLMFACICEI